MNYIEHTQFDEFEWIDITLTDIDTIDSIANQFKLDRFQVKDSQQPGHLPKYEKNPQYAFLILRAHTAPLDLRANNINALSNKLAIFFDAQRVITIHRAPFEFLHTRPHYPVVSADQWVLYLMHKVIQTYIKPAYFLSDRVDEMEQQLFMFKDMPLSLEALYFQKAQTRLAKKLLQLMQVTIEEMPPPPAYLSEWRDIRDDLVRLILMYDEVMDDSVSLLNTYLSLNAQKNNDVMKLLTVFSAFFLPLTFIAGIYGMNFKWMPETEYHWGYPITIGIMGLVALVIFWVFKRKHIL